MMSERVDRRDCPMRHKENGNCLPHGGFCFSVSAEICLALHNAYKHGEHDATNYCIDKLKYAMSRAEEETE